MKSLIPLTLFICSINLIGCSDSNSGTTNQVGAAISTARTKVANAVPDTSDVSSFNLESLSSINGVWTNASYAIGSDFGNSPRNAIRVHGDDTAQSSLMYRFKQNMDGLCIFTQALPTTGTDLTLNSGDTIEIQQLLKRA